jgi:hypothetical protein
MEGKEETEFVGGNIVPEILKFIEGKYFSSKIQQFYEENQQLFSTNPSIDSKEDFILEYTHDYKNAFDRYQALVDKLLEEFADEQGVSLKYVQGCCRDVGKPLQYFHHVNISWVDIYCK